MLASLQGALDAHARQCGDPVRAILMAPFDRAELDWDDFRGIPIESDGSLTTGVVRIDCLTTTVQAAIAEFRQALREGEGAVAEAEIRLQAKLEALGQARDDWWEATRKPGWWKEQANRAREHAAEERRKDAEERERAARDRIRDDQRESFDNELKAYLDAWMDMRKGDFAQENRGRPGEDANRPTEPNTLPEWFVESLREQARQNPLRPYDQGTAPPRAPQGLIRAVFGLVKRKIRGRR